jgi:hypothetical protein
MNRHHLHFGIVPDQEPRKTENNKKPKCVSLFKGK